MTDEHPTAKLLQQMEPGSLFGAGDLMAKDIVFHCFQPKLPDLEGDYVGINGIRTFFEALGALAHGTFKVEPISATAAEDELVVVQAKNSTTIDGEEIAVDVVLVWRIVDSRIAEIWDIPPAFYNIDQGSQIFESALYPASFLLLQRMKLDFSLLCSCQKNSASGLGIEMPSTAARNADGRIDPSMQ